MAVATPAAGSREPGRRNSRGGFNWTAVAFMAPAALLLLIFLVFPALYTLGLSFNRGRGGQFSEWVGFTNFINLFTNDPNFLRLGFPPQGALWNNVLWLVFYTFLSVSLGLLIAVMATRVRYEAIIKAVVFLPMAIAATAIGVIWSFVYFPNGNTGLLNAVLGIGGVGPAAFLGSTATVNWAIIAVGVWGSVGFCTVILSAALKGISTEVLEAARVDGASERAIFFRIIIPMISLPISVVAVTLVVNVIKLFDLPYVMTRGGPGASSRTIAFSMYQEAFPQGRFGYGAAIAIVMLLLLVPVLVYNVRRFRSDRVTA